MERLHLHTVQQLQLELAEARERSSSYADESHRTNSKDISQFGQNNGNHIDVNGSSTTSGNMSVLNGNADNVQSFASSGNTSTQVRSALCFFPWLPREPAVYQHYFTERCSNYILWCVFSSWHTDDLDTPFSFLQSFCWALMLVLLKDSNFLHLIPYSVFLGELQCFCCLIMLHNFFFFLSGISNEFFCCTRIIAWFKLSQRS